MQQEEFNALLLRVMDFFFPGGHFHFGAAVNNHRPFRAESQSRTHGIHRDVAAADHCDFLTANDRSVVFGKQIGLHQIGARQIFIRRIDAAQILAGDVHKDRSACAHPDENGIKSIGKKFIDCFRAADDKIRFYLNAHFFEIVHFRFHNGLRQTKLRNAVNQHAAGLMQSFKDGDIVTQFNQIARNG
ncbi:MAG: hypothetical protein BWX55_00948 [Deltaproteobacteria bacterium ADurb.Bin022]|nr:MAG: hypothetical protein BWX55_00948 [Deltaproteobacteria bacterium ADurb.Bin022]